MKGLILASLEEVQNIETVARDVSIVPAYVRQSMLEYFNDLNKLPPISYLDLNKVSEVEKIETAQLMHELLQKVRFLSLRLNLQKVFNRLHERQGGNG